MTGLDHLRNKILGCTACALRQDAKRPVPSTGLTGDRIFVIGRNPGEEDDKTGKPLIGPGGHLLDETWQKCGLKREDMYVTTLVKCHSQRSREPLPDEIKACSKWIGQELDLVKPRLVVTLGALAAECMTGISFVPEQVITVDKKFGDLKRGMIIVTLYHPGYILKNRPAIPEYEASWAKVAKMWDALLKKSDDPMALKGFI